MVLVKQNAFYRSRIFSRLLCLLLLFALSNGAAGPEPSPSNLPTQGASIFIIGNFNEKKSYAVSIGGTAAIPVLWLSKTSIQALASPGLGVSLSLEITSSNTKVYGELVSYDEPTVSAMHTRNAAPTSLISIVLYGSRYATADYSLSSRLGSSSILQTIWKSDSSMTVKVRQSFP
eukprot:760758-Hanusia_phi.AAC.1